MKTLLAATAIALSLTAGAITAQAHEPFLPVPGGWYPAHEFRGHVPQGYVYERQEYDRCHREYVPVHRHVYCPPPEPPPCHRDYVPAPRCHEPVRHEAPIVSILRFVFER